MEDVIATQMNYQNRPQLKNAIAIQVDYQTNPHLEKHPRNPGELPDQTTAGECHRNPGVLPDQTTVGECHRDPGELPDQTTAGECRRNPDALPDQVTTGECHRNPDELPDQTTAGECHRNPGALPDQTSAGECHRNHGVLPDQTTAGECHRDPCPLPDQSGPRGCSSKSVESSLDMTAGVQIADFTPETASLTPFDQVVDEVYLQDGLDGGHLPSDHSEKSLEEAASDLLKNKKFSLEDLRDLLPLLPIRDCKKATWDQRGPYCQGSELPRRPMESRRAPWNLQGLLPLSEVRVLCERGDETAGLEQRTGMVVVYYHEECRHLHSPRRPQFGWVTDLHSVGRRVFRWTCFGSKEITLMIHYTCLSF